MVPRRAGGWSSTGGAGMKGWKERGRAGRARRPSQGTPSGPGAKRRASGTTPEPYGYGLGPRIDLSFGWSLFWVRASAVRANLRIGHRG